MFSGSVREAVSPQRARHYSDVSRVVNHYFQIISGTGIREIPDRPGRSAGRPGRGRNPREITRFAPPGARAAPSSTPRPWVPDPARRRVPAPEILGSARGPRPRPRKSRRQNRSVLRVLPAAGPVRAPRAAAFRSGAPSRSGVCPPGKRDCCRQPAPWPGHPRAHRRCGPRPA